MSLNTLFEPQRAQSAQRNTITCLFLPSTFSLASFAVKKVF